MRFGEDKMALVPTTKEESMHRPEQDFVVNLQLCRLPGT
jgi:hypothetical protein